MKKQSPPTPADAPRASASGRFMPLLLGILAFLTAGLSVAHAYPNEVYKTGSLYHWKINNVVIGNTADLATAISNCIWNSTGAPREIHVLTGGDLSATLGLPPDVKLYCHGNTYTRSHAGIGIYCKGVANIGIYDMTISTGTHSGVQLTACNNAVVSGLTVLSGYIGLRVDSHPSRPYEFWSYGLTVQNCRFENLGSHGLETYGIDGVTIGNIIARNNGECGVLLNKTHNATVASVDAYRCSNGGGYAGLRFANDCLNITANYLSAVECGRGFFTVSTVKNCTLQNAYIRGSTSHAILLQNSDNVVVAGGTFTGDGLNHYTSVNCQINAVPIGPRRIVNAASGRALDVAGGGNADGSPLQLWDYVGGTNQKWEVVDAGGGRYNLRSLQTGGRAVDSSLNPVNGTGTYIWSYLNNGAQKWQIQSVGNGRFRLNSHLNLSQCLDSNGTANGSPVIMWSYWGGANQQWLIQNP